MYIIYTHYERRLDNLMFPQTHFSKKPETSISDAFNTFKTQKKESYIYCV